MLRTAVLLSLALAAAQVASLPPEHLRVGWAGLELRRDTWGLVFVESVAPGGCAARADLQAGDQVLRVVSPNLSFPDGGAAVPERALQEVAGLFQSGAVGSSLQVTVERRGARRELSLPVDPPGTHETFVPNPKEPPAVQHLRRMSWEQIHAMDVGWAAAVPTDGVRSDELGVEQLEARAQVTPGGGPVRLEHLSASGAWVVASARLHWRCEGEAGGTLEVQSGPAERRVRQTFALNHESGVVGADLYLWSLAGVRQACTQGQGSVDSTPVELHLTCADGRESRRRRSMPLALRCDSSGPEGSGRAFEFEALGRAPDLKLTQLYLGEPTDLEVSPAVCDAYEPQPSHVRVVRLASSGQVAESFPPFCEPRADGGAPERDPRPHVSLRPGSHEPVLLAVQAEFPDGSTRRTPAAELPVLDRTPAPHPLPAGEPEQLLAGLAERLPQGCGPKLLAWLKSQPGVDEAEPLAGGDLGVRLVDGRVVVRHCPAKR